MRREPRAIGRWANCTLRWSEEWLLWEQWLSGQSKQWGPRLAHLKAWGSARSVLGLWHFKSTSTAYLLSWLSIFCMKETTSKLHHSVTVSRLMEEPFSRARTQCAPDKTQQSWQLQPCRKALDHRCSLCKAEVPAQHQLCWTGAQRISSLIIIQQYLSDLCTYNCDRVHQLWWFWQISLWFLPYKPL